MLVTTDEILQHAHQNHYAVGAFNFSNLENLQAIVEAAEQMNSPVIVSTSQSAIKYAGLEYLAAMVKIAAKNTKVPVALHLDHGTDYNTIIQCIAGGWTSVMIDGSHHSLQDNIAVTAEIVKVAHAAGLSVEAELGRLSGIEDQISVTEKDAIYTNPAEAEEFVQKTGIDSLAIAIGTAHGKYKGVPKLDFDRLDEIKKLLNMPLVLHGSSGVPKEDIQKAVSLGINKINIDTDVRQAFTNGVHEVFKEKPEEYCIRKICGRGREHMVKLVCDKMLWFGSDNKA